MGRGPAARVLGLFREPVISLIRWRLRARFAFGGLWHSGALEIGPRLFLDHPALFQGCGRLVLGSDVKLGYSLAGCLGSPIVLQPRTPHSVIRIGNGTAIMNGCFVAACESITVGENCRIGSGCLIVDSDFHGIPPHLRDTPGVTAPVSIGDNVWFGVSATVLKGVQVGNDAILGAHAVITRNVPAGAIAVGNPMRIVGSVYDRVPESEVPVGTH